MNTSYTSHIIQWICDCVEIPIFWLCQITVLRAQKPSFFHRILQWVGHFPYFIILRFFPLVLLIGLSHHIKNIYYEHDFWLLILTLITWLNLVFSFCTVKLLLYCTHCNLLWKKVTVRSMLLRSGSSCFASRRVEFLHNLFGVLCMGDLSLLPPLLIYSIIYLYQYRLVAIYFIF